MTWQTECDLICESSVYYSGISAVTEITVCADAVRSIKKNGCDVLHGKYIVTRAKMHLNLVIVTHNYGKRFLLLKIWEINISSKFKETHIKKGLFWGPWFSEKTRSFCGVLVIFFFSNWNIVFSGALYSQLNICSSVIKFMHARVTNTINFNVNIKAFNLSGLSVNYVCWP